MLVGGIYSLRLRFDEQYPDKPPFIRFTTPMFHPNSIILILRSFFSLQWWINLPRHHQRQMATHLHRQLCSRFHYGIPPFSHFMCRVYSLTQIPTLLPTLKLPEYVPFLLPFQAPSSTSPTPKPIENEFDVVQKSLWLVVLLLALIFFCFVLLNNQIINFIIKKI